MRWSPHGRFVAVAGFGNLPGDLVFYEKKADGKCKKVGATRCEEALPMLRGERVSAPHGVIMAASARYCY